MFGTMYFIIGRQNRGICDEEIQFIYFFIRLLAGSVASTYFISYTDVSLVSLFFFKYSENILVLIFMKMFCNMCKGLFGMFWWWFFVFVEFNISDYQRQLCDNIFNFTENREDKNNILSINSVQPLHAVYEDDWKFTEKVFHKIFHINFPLTHFVFFCV